MAAADLSAREIHLWIVSLDTPPEPFDGLVQTLSSEERRRARRLAFARDRRRFLVRRGLRRALLARYADRHPSELQLFETECGKPELRGGQVTFSCSYSGGLALYAVASGRRVGIDVEGLRPVPGADEIARTLFNAAEYRILRGLPPRDRERAFLRCWTRKEAYAKARGTGLAEPLGGFVVRFGPDEVTLVERTDGGDGDGWSVASVSRLHGYVAAVAAEGRNWGVVCRRWS